MKKVMYFLIFVILIVVAVYLPSNKKFVDHVKKNNDVQKSTNGK